MLIRAGLFVPPLGTTILIRAPVALSLHTMSEIDSAWDYIERGVAQIMTQDLGRIKLTTEMYMNMYTAIHNFCVSSQPTNPPKVSSRSPRGQHTKLLGGELYQRLQDYLTEHLRVLFEGAPPPSAQDEVIAYYTAHWLRYITGATYLDHIFAYLNRHWVKQERDEGGRKRGVYEVNTLCLVLWRDHMFERLRCSLVPALLTLVERDRNGEPGVDYQSLQRCVQSLVAVGFDDQSTKRTNLLFYAEHFEKPFFTATNAYYAREAKRVLAEHGVVYYMRRVAERLLEERERVTKYLHPSTEELLMSECERLLIADHKEQLQNEFLKLLVANQTDDLHVMFRLLSKVPSGLDPVKQQLQMYVEQSGLERMEQLAAERQGANVTSAEYVEVLLRLLSHFERILHAAFEDSEAMKSATDSGCAKFINSNVVAKPSAAADSRTPELLARHADSLLRKSSKNKDPQTVEAGLYGVLQLLKYTEEKDVFEKHYSRMLSKRLVHQASANPDLELKMVTKLADYCGFEYSNKLQRMFQDIHSSEQLQQQFRELEEGNPLARNFAPFVLAEAFWPLPYREVKGFELPPLLKPTFDKFVEHYEQQHNTRRLKWLWNFGKGEMKLNLDNGKVVLLQVSIYQMMILLAFNDTDTLTHEQLEKDVQLPNELLDGSLDYIVKAGVLLESQPKVYTFNNDFKTKKLRVNLNLPLKVEQGQEASETEKQIEEQRQGFLQAIVVRVMKARRTLSHAQLVEEVKQQAQSRFMPSVKDIKRAITALLEREYIRRGDNETYEYSS